MKSTANLVEIMVCEGKLNIDLRPRAMIQILVSARTGTSLCLWRLATKPHDTAFSLSQCLIMTQALDHTITTLSTASYGSIIVGDPVAVTAPSPSSTSTTTSTVYAPAIIGYSPGPDPSSTLDCETPDFTAFVTSIAGKDMLGCGQIDATSQHIYATSCIPAQFPHMVGETRISSSGMSIWKRLKFILI